MKKFIAFGLSFLILLNIFGFDVIFLILLQQNGAGAFQIIDEGPETVPPGKLVVFSLMKDNPQFQNSREILYNNDMFDVVYVKNSGNDRIYYCVMDKKDTKVQTAFRSLNEVKDNPDSTPGQLAASVLKNLVKNYLPVPEVELNENYKSFQFAVINNLPAQSVIPEKISPPPRFQIIS